MMSSSNGSSFFHKSGMKGEVMGSRHIRCVFKLTNRKEIEVGFLLCIMWSICRE
jgi:hypothetical protein